MAVTIKKLGGDVQINVDTTLFYVESPTAPRKVIFDNRVSPPKVEIKIGGFDSGSILLSTLKLGDAEAIPANLADFQTKWGALFPNPADVASGSTTVTTDTTISGDGSSGSPLSVVSTLEATRIHAATSKVTPVDADEIALIDSAASNVLKKTLWSAVKATLKTYFDTLYNATNTNLVDKTLSNTYTAGAKQTFQASATTAGVALGGVTANPSSPASGDAWFRSDESKLRYYDGTIVRALLTEALAQTVTNKIIDAASNTILNLRPKGAQVASLDFTTTNATATDVTGMVVAVGASKKYRVTASLIVSCSSASGLKFTFTAPSGAAITSITMLGLVTSTSCKVARIITFGTLSSAVSTITSAVGFYISGYFTTGVTTGNLQLQVAAVTGGDTATVFIGSTMDVAEIE